MAENVGNRNTEALFHLVDASERLNFPDTAADQVATDGDSYIKTVMKRFAKNKLAMVSLGIFILLLLTALFANQIAPHPRDASVGRFQAAPYDTFYLGTDEIGRDVLTRLIHGTQVSMIVGIGSVAIYVVIGTTLGLVSGYFGGFIDSVIMRLTEAFMSFPFFMVILTLVSLLGSGIWV